MFGFAATGERQYDQWARGPYAHFNNPFVLQRPI